MVYQYRLYYRAYGNAMNYLDFASANGDLWSLTLDLEIHKMMELHRISAWEPIMLIQMNYNNEAKYRDYEAELRGWE